MKQFSFSFPKKKRKEIIITIPPCLEVKLIEQMAASIIGAVKLQRKPNDVYITNK